MHIGRIVKMHRRIRWKSGPGIFNGILSQRHLVKLNTLTVMMTWARQGRHCKIWKELVRWTGHRKSGQKKSGQKFVILLSRVSMNKNPQFGDFLFVFIFQIRICRENVPQEILRCFAMSYRLYHVNHLCKMLGRVVKNCVRIGHLCNRQEISLLPW